MPVTDDPPPDGFWAACAKGDAETLREMLRDRPDLVRARTHHAETGLHLAAAHPEALKILLASGADPNARDTADNATPLHLAAASGNVESVRILLDAGADVQAAGDFHKGDVIGWAIRHGNAAVVDLLLARGARHHIFSAMATGDLALVQRVIDDDPNALSRRRPGFEDGQTALHAAIAPPDGLEFLTVAPTLELLQLLVDRGADVSATDSKGRSPLHVAMLRGDRAAIRILKAAGADAPQVPTFATDPRALAPSISKSRPTFLVPDMRATVRWYESIGFGVTDRFEDRGQLMFAKVSFGACEFGLSPGPAPGLQNVQLWIDTNRIEEIYAAFKARQLRAMHRVLDGLEPEIEIPFEEDLYGQGELQFSVRDLNGLRLTFFQLDE